MREAWRDPLLCTCAVDAETCQLLLQAASGHMPADGSANELCVTAGVLSSVAGSPHAAHKLLSAYSGRLRSAQQRLLKPQNAGGWSRISVHPLYKGLGGVSM